MTRKNPCDKEVAEISAYV